MPSEWVPHTRCWMAWPCREALWGDHLSDAREAHADVANTIAQFEPVTMIANPESVAEVSLKCGASVSCVPMEHDDSWLRDNGPTFLTDRRGGLAGVDWRFNGWGNRYPSFEKDAAVAAAVLDHLGVPRFEPPVVLEGGAYHVDGEGTLLATEESVLNANRNPGIGRGEMERYLEDFLGVETIVWLARGLSDDETDGHVDNLACFIRPATVLALTTADRSDSNYEALQENLERLRSARDAKGRALEVITVEQPRPMVNAKGERLAASYVSFYIANGGVVMPSFEDPNDEDAYEVVSGCFPDRRVIQVPVLDVLVGGGGIHAITLQQPEPRPEVDVQEGSGEA